jgi:hypothetical protein
VHLNPRSAGELFELAPDLRMDGTSTTTAELLARHTRLRRLRANHVQLGVDDVVVLRFAQNADKGQPREKRLAAGVRALELHSRFSYRKDC